MELKFKFCSKKKPSDILFCVNNYHYQGVEFKTEMKIQKLYTRYIIHQFGCLPSLKKRRRPRYILPISRIRGKLEKSDWFV